MPKIQEKMAELAMTLYAVHVAEAELFDLPKLPFKDWMDSEFVPEGDKRIQCYSSNVLEAIVDDAKKGLAAIQAFKSDLAEKHSAADEIVRTLVGGLLHAGEARRRADDEQDDDEEEEEEEQQAPNFDFLGIKDPLARMTREQRCSRDRECDHGCGHKCSCKTAKPDTYDEELRHAVQKAAEEAARKVFGDKVSVKATIL
jgi:hypothetical protein